MAFRFFCLSVGVEWQTHASLAMLSCKKIFVSAMASARPTLSIFTSGGKADVSRVGKRLSSITKTPRSVCRRISRPKACRSLSLVCLSVQLSRPCQAARAAQVPVVAAGYGYCDKPPAELGADAVIDSFADLVPALRRIATTS